VIQYFILTYHSFYPGWWLHCYIDGLLRCWLLRLVCCHVRNYSSDVGLWWV